MSDVVATTIILVPGWYVTPSGTCDLVSRRRVEGALALLALHPEATVVFSGWRNPRGFGRAREVSEARAMYDYAVAQGMHPRQGWLEEQATCTVENREYCDGLIRRRVSGPTRRFVISSDFQFARHQMLFDGYEQVRVATRARSRRSAPLAVLWFAYGAVTEYLKLRRSRRQGRAPEGGGRPLLVPQSRASTS